MTESVKLSNRDLIDNFFISAIKFIGASTLKGVKAKDKKSIFLFKEASVAEQSSVIDARNKTILSYNPGNKEDFILSKDDEESLKKDLEEMLELDSSIEVLKDISLPDAILEEATIDELIGLNKIFNIE